MSIFFKILIMILGLSCFTAKPNENSDLLPTKFARLKLLEFIDKNYFDAKSTIELMLVSDKAYVKNRLYIEKLNLLEIRPKKLSKRMLVSIEVVSGGLKKVIPVWFKVSKFKDVFITEEYVYKNKNVHLSQLGKLSFDILKNPIDPVFEIDTPMIWNENTSKNMILTKSMVSEEPDIRTGDNILLNSINKGVRITTKGVALNNANIGEVVNIQVDYSQLPIEGTVYKKGVAIYEN